MLQDFFAKAPIGLLIYVPQQFFRGPEQYLVIPPHSPEKNEFGICRGAVSHCLEGLTCTLQSLLGRYSITFSIPPHPHSISVQIWTNYETRFSKSGGTYPQTLPLAAPVTRPCETTSIKQSIALSRYRGECKNRCQRRST